MSGAIGAFTDAISGIFHPWMRTLQRASWRGIPFSVRGTEIRRGRRTAVHEYPGADDVWVEDLGRGTRTISFHGFIVGDDCYKRRDLMLKAAELAGAGDLVHPSLGAVRVTLVDFSAGERADLGRVVEIDFAFIQGQDLPRFPAGAVGTPFQNFVNAALNDIAIAVDFVAQVQAFVALGVDVVNAGLRIVTGFIGLGQTLMGDASLISHAVLGLFGNNGRYSTAGLTVLPPSATTVAQVLAGVVAARAAAAAVGAVAASAAPTDLPAALIAYVAAVAAVAPAPGDQVRLLLQGAAFSPALTPANTAPIGAAIAVVEPAVGSLVRRACLSALARALSVYQPTSYNDAAMLIGSVSALFDAEMVSAADQGNTASFVSLRALRTAVVMDLNTRGALVARLATVTRGSSMPSLTLAYQLYADASRSDDLIARVDPPNPLFMPLVFEALVD